MWQLLNRTPFAAERAFIRGRDGAEYWVVIVKGTFQIQPSQTHEVAAKQVPVYAVPQYWGEPGNSSLRYDTDFNLTKLGTDVLVNGHIYAPHGREEPEVLAHLSVGPVSRTIRATGNRFWRSGIFTATPSPAEPFTQMPLRFEFAFGGTAAVPKSGEFEPRNPVGKGFVGKGEDPRGRPLPNLEDPRTPCNSPGDRPPPVCYGPTDASWSPRIELAGTFDVRWRETRMPLLPADFDEQYYYCAAVEQRVPGFLREGSAVKLVNLSAEGILSFHLPAVRPTFRTRMGQNTVRHSATLHTVLFEPDDMHFIMVWHTALACHGIEHQIEKTVIEVKKYS